MKRLLRRVQVELPWIRRIKFESKNVGTQAVGAFIDGDFLFLKKVDGIDHVVDVGGNWGQSVHAFKHLCTPREIVTFEPSPILGERLKAKFARDPGVRVETCALGEAEGSFTLYTPVYKNYVWDGLASTIESEARDWLNADRMIGFDPARVSLLKNAVPVRTLDSFGLSPDLIKIDVQGAELAVVKGGMATLERSKPICIIENPGADLVATLGSIGLSPFRYADGAFRAGDLDGTNTIFLSADWIARIGKAGTAVR